MYNFESLQPGEKGFMLDGYAVVTGNTWLECRRELRSLRFNPGHKTTHKDIYFDSMGINENNAHWLCVKNMRDY